MDRHWTKRLWFYLIVFQVWKPQWKRVLVHGQLATQHAQVFSSACAAVAETTFALCLETGICNYCSHTFQRPSPGQPCHQEEVGTPRPLLPVIVHPRRGKGGNSWMRCMCRVLQSNPWRHGTEYGSQTAYFTWIPTENGEFVHMTKEYWSYIETELVWLQTMPSNTHSHTVWTKYNSNLRRYQVGVQ